MGRRVWHELRAPDAASVLVLEGLALELVVAADRVAKRGDVAPVWLTPGHRAATRGVPVRHWAQ